MSLRIDVNRLPQTDDLFVGRDDELRRLDDAWEHDGTHVVTVVAWGGVGKTALVNRWLGKMSAGGYGGAVRVYGWSFYSQGTDEQRVASADLSGSPRYPGLKPGAIFVRPKGTKRQAQPALLRSPEGGIR